MTAQQKAIKAKLAESSDIYPDKVICKRDGTVVVKRSFFYKHSMTAETWGERVLAASGLDVQLCQAYEDWQAWPKTSYFVAIIKGV